jgi:hypothetical protein
MAIGIMYEFILHCLSSDMFSRLESGAIYCIMAILLDIAVSLCDDEIYYIGVSIGEQLIVSPDSFRLIQLTYPPEHDTYVHTGVRWLKEYRLHSTQRTHPPSCIHPPRFLPLGRSTAM